MDAPQHVQLKLHYKGLYSKHESAGDDIEYTPLMGLLLPRTAVDDKLNLGWDMPVGQRSTVLVSLEYHSR
jgi:hypothetical protein